LYALRVQRVAAPVVRRDAEGEGMEVDVPESPLPDRRLDPAEALVDAERVVPGASDETVRGLGDRLCHHLLGLVDDEFVVITVRPHLQAGEDGNVVTCGIQLGER